jgi:hypothetical protein
LFANNPEVFVAGDLVWYPGEGRQETCQAPDVLVAFGRPKAIVAELSELRARLQTPDK